MLTRIYSWLLAYDSWASDFFDMPLPIGYNPMTAQELRCLRAFVGNSNSIRKEIIATFGPRLFGDVSHAGFDAEFGRRALLILHKMVIGPFPLVSQLEAYLPMKIK